MSKHMSHQWFLFSHLGWTAGYSGLCVVLSGLLTWVCYASDSADPAMVRFTVNRVSFDPISRSPIVWLLDEAQTRVMPIWIGIAEARAIEYELRGQPTPRPLTHDLLKNILDQAGVGLDKVVVSELKGRTYYARIHLTTAADHPIEIDSRPSDAIALALRFERPIFVARGLLEATLLENVHSRGVTVQNLSQELARVFQLPGTHGVLVADVETGAAAQGHLQRGDIILTIAGKTIKNIRDFQTRMREEHGQTIAMQIHRDGRAMGISLPTAVP